MNEPTDEREIRETPDMPEQNPVLEVDDEALALLLEAITDPAVSEPTTKSQLNVLKKSLIPEGFLNPEDDLSDGMNRLRISLEQTAERNNALVREAINTIQLQVKPEELAETPNIDNLYSIYDYFIKEFPPTSNGSTDLRDTNILISQSSEKISGLEDDIKRIDKEIQESMNTNEIEMSIDQINESKVLRGFSTEEEEQMLDHLYDLKIRLQELTYTRKNKSRELQGFNRRKEKLEIVRQRIIVLTERAVTKRILENNEDNLYEMISDGFFIQTIRKKYFDKYVLNEIEDAFNVGIISENDIRDMFILFNDYINNINSPNSDEKAAQEIELKRLFSKHSNLKKTSLFFYMIKDGWDESTISILTKQLSINQLKRLQNSVDDEVDDDRLVESLTGDREVKKMFNKSWTNTLEYHSFQSPRMRNLYVHDKTLGVTFLSTWQISSEILKENDMLTDEVSQIDEILQNNILEEILDGKTFSLRELEYFNSPQVIRILFILSTNNKDFFLSGESLRMLNQLYESDRWDEIRDSSISTYPNLRGCIELFERKNKESNPNTLILKNQLRTELTKEIIDMVQNADDKRYARLAAQSLDLKSLFEILIQNGTVDIDSYPNIQLIIEDFNSKLQSILQDPKVNQDDVSNLRFHQRLVEELSNKVLDQESIEKTRLMKFEILSEFILQELKDSELDSKTIFDVFSDKALSFDQEEDLLLFLETIRTSPILLSNQSLFENYCKLYKTESSSQYVQLLTYWKDKPEDLGSIYQAIENGYITARDASTLHEKIGELGLGKIALKLSLEFPELFIHDPNGIDLLQRLVASGVDNIGNDYDLLLGNYMMSIRNSENIRFNKFIDYLIQIDIDQINTILDQPEKGRKDLNWKQVFLAYGLLATGITDEDFKLNPNSLKKLEGLLAEEGLIDNYLKSLRDEYQSLLENGNLANPTGSLLESSEIIHGLAAQLNLSQVATLGHFINAIAINSAIETTSPKSTRDIQQGLLVMEEKMKEGRWANFEKSYFYDISRKILNTSPSLFSSYLELMQDMSKNEFKVFVKEVYPLFKTKLILLQSDSKPDLLRNLVIIRKDVRDFHAAMVNGEMDSEQMRQQLSGEIVGLVKERYGIKDLPDTLTPEQYRSINNFAMYLSNMEGKNELKENILALYLALTLKGEWKQLRSGNKIDLQEYLKEEHTLALEPIVGAQELVNSRIYGILGVDTESRQSFQSILQSDEMVRSEGMVQTTDVKLMNLISNLRIFDDPDIFSDELDLVRYNLVGEYGDKTLNKTVALIYRSLLNGNITLGEDDQQIRTEIEAALKKSNLEFTPENVKRYFQQGLIPFANIYKIKQTIVEGNVERRIEDLRQSLLPPSKIIDIFAKLGEDFRPQSGAMALTQDINFLENLVVKKESELTQEELDEISKYLSPIRQQLIVLEEINQILAGKTKPYNYTDVSVRGDQLREQFKMIDEIVNSKNEIEPLVSTSTNDLNTIIENLRACLSCKTAEINNSTNLTFGESYKFYLYSATASQSEGSIADQIVYFVPIKMSGDEYEMSFVFDQVYGNSTPLILSNHIGAIIAKMSKLRAVFPNMQLSIFIPKKTLTSVGTSAEILRDQYLSSDLLVSEESLIVDIPHSEFGDHYVEISDESAPREPGQREAQGVLLRMH